MNALRTLLILVSAFGVLQAVLLGLTVATVRAGPRRSNRVLSLILLGAAAAMAVILESHRQHPFGGVGPEILEYAFWPFAGPILYLYVTLVTTSDRMPPRSFLLHLVPGCLLLSHLAVWSALSASGTAPVHAPWLPPALWMVLYQVAYTLLAFARWRREVVSGLDRSTLGFHSFWTPALFAVLAVVHSAQAVRWLFRSVEALDDVVPLAGSAALVVATGVGLRTALPHLGPKRRRYLGSALTPERAAAIVERFETAMETGRPYLRTDLTLEGLADEIGVPKTYLSQVVNEHYRQNLPDLLSGYRLRESERLLADSATAHLTIEAVARRSGFASRSTFYEAFRRRHSVSPAEYRKRANGR